MEKWILVVDDEPILRKEITQILRRMGFGAAEVSNGKEALEFLKKSKLPVAAVISDNNMPEMAGEQLLTALREDESLKAIPFGLLTAKPSPDLRKKIIDQGGIFAEKPIRAAAVRELARTLVPLV